MDLAEDTEGEVADIIVVEVEDTIEDQEVDQDQKMTEEEVEVMIEEEDLPETDLAQTEESQEDKTEDQAVEIDPMTTTAEAIRERGEIAKAEANLTHSEKRLER